ncbi:MAG TPA: hypothetical protein VFA26_16520 [Gemmataceae bacterium]|nr:hypothetical protein [Gemmataceae bacterium]
MVNHVKTVAILMIVQGALTSLMGLLYTVMGPTLFALMKMDKSASPPGGPDAVMMTIMPVFYIVVGLFILASGVLNLVGGLRAMKFQNRTFVIVALFTNIAPLITCYCAPTGIGLMIYGLIVLFQSDVALAFQMRADGWSVEEITDHFSARRADRWDEEGPARPAELPPRPPAEPSPHVRPADDPGFHPGP